MKTQGSRLTKGNEEPSATSHFNGASKVLSLCVMGMLLVLSPSWSAAESPDAISERSTASLDSTRSQYQPTKTKVSWFRRHFGKVGWEEAVIASESPADVCSFVAGRIRYVSEKSDRWSTARDTWTARAGDCEDFAICIVEMCRQLGIVAWVQLYFPPNGGEGHAVAVGYWKGQMWMSSLGRYESVEDEDEVKEVVSSVLWCDKDEMWNARLDEGAVARRIAKHQVQRMN